METGSEKLERQKDMPALLVLQSKELRRTKLFAKWCKGLFYNPANAGNKQQKNKL